MNPDLLITIVVAALNILAMLGAAIWVVASIRVKTAELGAAIMGLTSAVDKLDRAVERLDVSVHHLDRRVTVLEVKAESDGDPK